MGQVKADARKVKAQIEWWSTKIDELSAKAGKISAGPDVAPMVGDGVAQRSAPRDDNGPFVIKATT